MQANDGDANSLSKSKFIAGGAVGAVGASAWE